MTEQREAALNDIIAGVGIRLGLGTKKIRGGDRRGPVPTSRYLVGHLAVRKYGHPAAEVARELEASS